MQLYNDLPSHSDPARQETTTTDILTITGILCVIYVLRVLIYSIGYTTEPNRRGCRFKKSSPFPWR